MNRPLDLGYSGAEIVECLQAPEIMVKRGKSIGLQGGFLRVLGPRVSPEIYTVQPDHYTMERLGRWYPYSPADACESILRLLATHVWSRPAAIQESFCDISLCAWLSGQSTELVDLYVNIYRDRFPEEVLTHGDPTVANGMVNAHNELRLIDAIPAKDRVPTWIVTGKRSR